MKHPNWTRILIILGVVLASCAVLYIVSSVLLRFTQAILLFVLSGIVAYVLNPLVDRLEMAFRHRWMAITLSYLMVALAAVTLGVYLFTPFVQQTQSLIDNLRTPSAGSLQTIVLVQKDIGVVENRLERQQPRVTAQRISAQQVATTQSLIANLQRHLDNLRNGTVSGHLHPVHPEPTAKAGQVPPNPQPQTRVPPSYVASIMLPVNRLRTDYADATQTPGTVDTQLFAQARKDAKSAGAAARRMYTIMSTTPILLVRSQTWLDEHNLHVDVIDKIGQASQQLSNQSALILDNAIAILSETAKLLLNTALVLILSFYLLNDGPRLLRRGVELSPPQYRELIAFFIRSLDKVLGGYIRGQIFCSFLAGLLAGGGAAVLGVPYPLLIGIMTFILQSIPVIGPMISVVPAVAISLFFMPIVTTIIFFAWFIVFQQIVSNIIGPRVMGAAVGIHPLEAIFAVLVGYPLGGLLGAFLAVPVAGILHIMIREAYSYFVLGKSAAAVLGSMADDYPEPEALPQAVGQTSDPTATRS